MASQSGETNMSDVEEDSSNANIEERDQSELFIEECQKYAFSDGKYFEIDMEKSSLRGTLIGVCKLCVSHKTIKGSFKSPSNFSTHIKRMHTEQYQSFLDYRKTKSQTPEVRDRESHTITCKFSQRKFEANVTNYVIESMAPLSTVAMPSFQKIFDNFQIKHRNKSLKHLTRNTLCNRLEQLYQQKMQEISTNLREDAIYVCTTTDIWTSRSRRFIGVTAHWIDSETLMRKSVAIACRRFPGTHSAARIADILTEINASFGLDAEKIVATVTDNGSNFVKAFREFGAHITESFLDDEQSRFDADESFTIDLPSDSNSHNVDVALEADEAVYEQNDTLNSLLPKHLRCASHTLHLIATVDTTKIIKASSYLSSIHFGALERCTALWKALRSPKTNETIKQHLGTALPRPVVTRWNSIFVALERIIAFKEKVVEVSTLVGISNVLNENDFRYIEQYLKVMKPLAETIDILQGESYCYYGYLLPSLVSLRRKMSALHQSNVDMSTRYGPLVIGIIQALEDRFHIFFAVENEVAGSAIAAASHPRLKLRWLASFPEATRRNVENLFLRAAAEERRKGGELTPEVNVVQREADDFFDFGEESENTPPCVSGIESIEIAKYMANPSTDLLMLNEYPLIRKLFIKYNTPLPSSAPVERLFSFATMMDLPEWNRLSEEHFEQCVLMKANAIKASVNAST